jgi:hypothetical protein
MAETQVEKFDPSKLMDGVKDRIKATFVSLIPDDQWEIMVKKEMDSFFEPCNFHLVFEQQRSNNYYSGPEKIFTVKGDGTASPFRLIVWQMCYDKSIELIKKKLTDTYFGDTWTADEGQMKEELKKVIQEATPVAMLKFFEHIALGQVNTLRNEIQNFR